MDIISETLPYVVVLGLQAAAALVFLVYVRYVKRHARELSEGTPMPKKIDITKRDPVLSRYLAGIGLPVFGVLLMVASIVLSPVVTLLPLFLLVAIICVTCTLLLFTVKRGFFNTRYLEWEEKRTE